jgi:excisionase family DNA binding protein
LSSVEQEPLFLLPKEAASLAGLSTRAIYRAVQRGELGAVRLCSPLRIPREAFDAWVERGRVRPEEPPRTTVVAASRYDERGSFRRLLSAAREGSAAP